jgi:hypothetical protein
MPKTTAPAAEAAETKADKFKRLAVSRTNKALDAISNLGGLASTTNYEYTDEQVAKIFAALEGEMTKLQARFKSPDAVAVTGFSL